jgi:hypothetical protein
LAIKEHFPQLPQLLQDQHGLTLSHDCLWEIACDVGAHAERLKRAEAARCRVGRAAAVTPFVTPKRVYVTLDGINYPTNLSEPDPHDPTPQKTVYQQMKVGAVYWQDDREHWHKQMTWGRESPDDFAAVLYRLACRCGYEQAEQKLFAADGRLVLGQPRHVLFRGDRHPRLVPRQRTRVGRGEKRLSLTRNRGPAPPWIRCTTAAATHC